MQRVIVHIDSLVLKGFRHEDRHALALGLQQELSQWFADPQVAGQLATTGDVSRLRVGNININPGSPPQRVGSQVAQSIGKGMKK